MTAYMATHMVLTLSALLTSVMCTWDMNVHQIQMVADHLSLKECRRLSEALRESTYSLSHELTGDGEEDVPCLALLLDWDQNKGRSSSFVEMTLRLKEIGRPDLADRLSKVVTHELSENAKRNYMGKDLIDNLPTEETIREDFPLVKKRPPEETVGEAPPGDWTWKHTLAVTLASVGLTSLCIVTVVCYLPGKCKCRDAPFYADVRERFYMRVVGIPPPEGEKMFIFI